MLHSFDHLVALLWTHSSRSVLYWGSQMPYPDTVTWLEKECTFKILSQNSLYHRFSLALTANSLQRNMHQTQVDILPVLQPPPVSQHQKCLISGTGFLPTLATVVLVGNYLLAIIKKQVLPWELAVIICCIKRMKTSFWSDSLQERTWFTGQQIKLSAIK